MLRAVRIALVVVGVLLGIAGTAEANCPDKRASCVLHEEGVQLFLDKNYDEAAKKFAAAIAAEPTARSYLGYAQAVESLGQIALAYDTMVAAKRLSDAEVQANGKDSDVIGRAERIKYKLGELRAKIGFVWLRVPDGVPPQRVVAVKREGEGDLAQPLTQWTAVAPDHQNLIATLDDGKTVQLEAQVAAGSPGVLVIPIARTQPIVNPNVQRGTGRPLAQLYMPVPRAPERTYSAYFAVGLSVLAPGPQRESSAAGESSGSGTGFTFLYERKFASSLGLTGRFEYVFHSTNTDFSGPNAINVSGSEALFLAGARTMGSRTLHGRAGVGVAIYTENQKVDFGGPSSGFTRAYPALELGGGLNLGRVRLQMGLLFSPGPGDPTIPSLGTRFMGTFAIDLYRKAEPLPKPEPLPAGMPPAPPR